jgi:WD40 repeat protein
MRKISLLFLTLIALSLLLSACTDQPTPRSLVAPQVVVAPPSTPGPTTTSDTPTADPDITVPVLTTPTPQPTPSRPATPAPFLSETWPDMANLTALTNDPVTGREIARYTNQDKTDKGQLEPLRALALSPNRQWLALADRYQIWIVEATTGKPIQTLFASNANSDEWGAHSLAWSPDGKLLAAGGLGGVTTMWHWDNPANEFRKGPDRLSPGAMAEAFGDAVEVAFSPDSQHLATFGSDGNLNIYSTTTAQLQATFTSDFAGYVSWSPDSKRLADEFLVLHYLASNQSSWPDDSLALASDGPQGVAWSPDGKLLAVSSDGFELLLVEAPPLDPTNQAASKEVIRVKLRTTSNQSSAMPHLKEGRRVAWSPSGRWVAVANVPAAGQISLWDYTGKPLLTLDTGSEVLRTLLWPHDNLLLSASNAGLAQLWQLEAAPPIP